MQEVFESTALQRATEQISRESGEVTHSNGTQRVDIEQHRVNLGIIQGMTRALEIIRDAERAARKGE